MAENRAAELLYIWFVNPLKLLEEKIGADAGWIFLMVTLPLYERWIHAKLKKDGRPGEFYRLMMDDLKLGSMKEAEIFWKSMRDGVLHRAMPKITDRRNQNKADDVRYVLHPDCSAFPVFGEYDGELHVFIDPCKFGSHVLQILKNDPDMMLVEHEEFPFASVEPLDERQLRRYCPGPTTQLDLEPQPQTKDSPQYSGGTVPPR